MPDLEQQLTELAGSLDWPATPNLRTRVGSQLVTSPSAGVPAPQAREWPSAGWGRWVGNQRRLALAAAALLVAAAALVAYTPTREAIAGWVNLHVHFFRAGELPTPSPIPAGPIGKRLGLGDQTTMANAQGAVPWTILVPSTVGRPDEVYLQPSPAAPPRGEVSLVYTSAPGIPTSAQTGVALLITEVQGSVNANFFGKMIGPDATIEAVNVGGHQGYWISGKPHSFLLLDSDGNTREETLRLAGNTLLIDEGGTIVRIEGDLTRAQALELTAGLH